MDKIDIHLDNCYGIKKMRHSFDFTKSKTHLIYAPNGVMKSSLARTLEDISLNKPTKDRIFSERVTHREVKIDGRDILNDEIFVIQRMKETDFKEASTILANEELKSRYDTLNSRLNESKNEFIKLMQPFWGIKENAIENEFYTIFKINIFSVFKQYESQINEISEPLYTNIVYNEIFNEKVVKFINTKDFKIKIKDYINTYDKLVNENNTLFMKGTFNHYNADTITRSLKDNKFFDAKHKVKIRNQEVGSVAELEDLIKAEKEKVLNNPELTTKFNEIDKSLNSNTELRNFRSYIEQNQEIIKEFVDLENFRKKLIINYLAVNKSEFNVLLRLYKETNTQRNEIIVEAKKEQEDWKNVINIFNRRFTVPFKVKIKNQEDVILKNEPASLVFEYTDGISVKELGGIALNESLSTGEQRVFYLLNIIFQIETRKRMNKKQLVVIDDIADSFDYKNKYAIIEYLKDILDDPQFYMIVLTHNFDFYRTIKKRLGDKINYQGNWKTIKKTDEIVIVEGEKKDEFPRLRKNFHNCDTTFIACIPFVRNLIEFSVGEDCDDYHILTSLLHLKPENTERNIPRTTDLTKAVVGDIFNRVFGLAENISSPDDKIYDLIFLKSDEIMQEPRDCAMDIKNKICLSLAIRIKAEEFMLSKITNADFLSKILKKETGKIVGQFKTEFPNEFDTIGILDRVNLMTSENIHINSFMYEPLMDLTDDHLRTLYQDVKNLN